ncbi:hypothetical protein EMPS_04220 [Entomortierella parvispora]|uniref:ATP-dependent DNA ligase family profile domain-containing protein n=1 Tax=Entomortierella parvispora TaxID=205924 RepID=A0A9P3H8P4_9FUNG|nr:hypothetical protein EMPS_04220 [Entomortierella parvispora]
MATKASTGNAHKTVTSSKGASTTAANPKQIPKGKASASRKATITSAVAASTATSRPKNTRKKGGAESRSSRSQTALSKEQVDYRHSTAPPTEELDRLQALVDKLLATNSTTAKRDIISQHLDQAPLLAWIYDPYRNFHVKSSNIMRYALLRAQQRDEGATSKAADPEGKGSTENGGGPLEMSPKQRQDAEARTLALGQGYDHLAGLLMALSTRAISGYTALDAIILFMDRFLTRNNDHGETHRSHIARTQALFEDPRSKLLFKILDKNLKTGCSINTLRDMFPAHLLPRFNVALAHSLYKVSSSEDLFPSTPLNAIQPTKTARNTAKGKVGGITPWFASRKLDGVRCLMRIDRETGGVEVKSRTGKDLGNEGIFRSTFQQRGILPLHGSEMRLQAKTSSLQGTGIGSGSLDRFFSLALGHDANSVQLAGLPDAIFLDGEICVFSSASSSSNSSSSSSAASGNSSGKRPAAADLAAAAELGTENFTKAISFARRGLTLLSESEVMGDEDRTLGSDIENDPTNEDVFKEKKPKSRSRSESKKSGSAAAPTTTAASSDQKNSSLDKAMFCVFDCLTEDEFQSRKGTRRFSERIQGLKNALKAFPVQENPLPVGDESSLSLPSSELAPELDVSIDVANFIQVLTQTELKSFKQLEEMVSRGMELGWEGVMLRKDVGYEGKRSRNLLKIKQFRDAEYVVEDVMVGSMRLPFRGEYQDRDQVMTSVVIRHRGNRVGVGSGFTVEDRIRYGKDPKSLLGKTITVQYFEESQPMAATTASTTGSTADAGCGSDETGIRNLSDKTERPEDGPQEVWSLRFPTVKAIYDRGPRQM